MSVDSENAALLQLANLGLTNPAQYAQLPNQAGLTQEATGLSGIVSTPLDFGAQNAILGQQTANVGNIDALANNLGVQKAVGAQEADKLSREGGLTAGNAAIAAQDSVSKVGQVGQQEQNALSNLGLSERSNIALARLNQTAQTLQQQGLQTTAGQATTQTLRDIGLKNQQGDQQVTQAAQTALGNDTAIMQKYNAQQWDFWTKIANGLITAAGTGIGFLVGGPAGAVVGGAAGQGVAQATVGSGSNSSASPTLQSLDTPATQLTQPGDLSYAGQTPSTPYTMLPDSLPVT